MKLEELRKLKSLAIKDCERCHGRGWTSYELETHALIPCLCTTFAAIDEGSTKCIPIIKSEKQLIDLYTKNDCARLFRSLIRHMERMPSDTPSTFYNTLYIHFNPIVEVMKAMILIGSVNASDNEEGRALLRELQNVHIGFN